MSKEPPINVYGDFSRFRHRQKWPDQLETVLDLNMSRYFATGKFQLILCILDPTLSLSLIDNGGKVSTTGVSWIFALTSEHAIPNIIFGRRPNIIFEIFILTFPEPRLGQTFLAWKRCINILLF